MAESPAATITILYADTADGPRLWELHGEAMSIAAARRDALLREAIGAHGGTLVPALGDALCARFETIPEAVEAALAAQRVMAGETWEGIGRLRLRMALATGTGDAESDDVPVPLRNRAVRLVEAAHGGQVLLARSVDILGPVELPDGVQLRDLGTRQLPELERAERVFQVVAPDVPRRFPPLNTLDRRSHNLPAAMTPFLGRDGEVADAEELVRRGDTRLLTFTGLGGVGKTRLALEVAAGLLDEHADGAWLVDLSPVRDPALVPSAIAEALRLRATTERQPRDALLAYLRERQLLLLLDNFEQVTQASPLVRDLLAASPRLMILVTSRVRLNTPDEREFPVLPLPLPDPTTAAPAEHLGEYAAVRLFEERAQATRPGFSITDANAPVVAALCRRLEGLPLAIELAAAWSKLLSPQGLLARLEKRLGLPLREVRDLPARHQTMRSVIAWSEELLAPAEQIVFRQLAVFVGGCTVEAAAAVCDPPGSEGDLTTLADASLLRRTVGAGGEVRFSMLETVREYGLEQLAAAGDEESLRRRHAAWSLSLAERAGPDLAGPRQAASLAQLAADHDNLRGALDWTLAHDAGSSARLGAALWPFWQIRGHLSEGRRWLERILAADGASEALRSELLRGAGTLALAQADLAPAVRYHGESLELSRRVGNQRVYAYALVDQGAVAMVQEPDQRAGAFLAEALTLFRRLGDREGIARTLQQLGTLAFLSADYGLAAARYQDSLTLARELPLDPRTIAAMLVSLGNTLRHWGSPEAAERPYAEALALFRGLADQHGVATALAGLGRTTHARGDLPLAASQLAESLSLSRQLGDQAAVAEGLEGLAAVAGDQGQPIRAARLFGAAEALREAIGAPLRPAYRAVYEEQVATVRSVSNEPTFPEAWQAGRALRPEQAIAEALSVADRTIA